MYMKCHTIIYGNLMRDKKVPVVILAVLIADRGTEVQ